MSAAQILVFLLSGGLAGFVAGYIGLGGGAVLTPICLMLYPWLGLDRPDLIRIIFGTNMFLVTVFSISAVLKHHANNNIRWKTVAILGPLAIIGSMFGASAGSVIDPVLMKKGFAALLLVSSFLIILRGSTKPTGSHETVRPLVPIQLLPLLGLVAGFMASLLGIGGGIVMIPALILLFHFPIEKVAGTSSSVIVFIGISGTIGYIFHSFSSIDLPGWSTGYVWWQAAVPLAIGGIPMARVGAWLNSRTDALILKRIFGAILFIIALRILL